MADNNEIIVGGGQAVKPDQATIDALVEKLKEKLMARKMIQERIDQLLAKYREYLPKWLTLTHKYITLYPRPTGNADYNRDYATIYTDEPVFEEVNWSAVDYPEERPDEYRFSRRLSNMYHYADDPVDYKFPDVDTSIEEEELHWTFNEETGEYEQVPRTMVYKADAAGIIDRYDQSTSFRLATYNHNDDIRTIFFLEIVWGYSGWEWHDYERVIGTDPETEEPITEILKGGNLYKLKEITTVPHIIDGHRLYHINDFLNSQDKVTIVEEFDTSHLIAINRAFKRLDLKHNLNTITPLLLKVYQFPNVEEANDVFFNNKISVIDNHAIEFPLLKNVDGFYQRGEFVDGTTFKLNNLESFTDGFFWTNFSQTDFNLGDILVGDSLKKVSNLSGLLHWAMFYNGREDNDYNKPVNTFTIDLSGSSLPASTEFNLSNLAYESGTNYSYPNNTGYGGLTDRYFIFNLTLKGLTDLSSAFRKIMQHGYYGSPTIKGISYNGRVQYTGPTNIEVNFNNTESLIRNLDYAFAENIFSEQPPITHWINNYTTENYIYQGCQLNDGITYNFSPNLILNPSEGQFNDCYIDPTKTIVFTNVDALQKVRFQNINFGTESTVVDGETVTTDIGRPFPYSGVIHNDNYQYNEDPTDKHRFVSFSGSKFTSLTSNQNIYCDIESSRRTFTGCSLIDFTNSGIKLYLKGVTSSIRIGDPFDTFKNCTSMVTTPELHGSIYTSTNQGEVPKSMFYNCPNLERIDAADFELTNWTVYAITLDTSPNLKYLNMGNVIGGFNLRGCYRFLEDNEALDMLAATLNRQTALSKRDASNTIGDDRSEHQSEGLWIQRAVWTALQSRHSSLITKLENLENRTIHVIEEV